MSSKIQDLTIFKNQYLVQQTESISLEGVRIAAEGSKSVARIISGFLSLARKNSISDVSIECFPEDYSLLSNRLDGERLEKVKDTNVEILERANDPKTVFISTVKLDPVFGFSGIPTKLLRKCSKDKMREAYNSRTTNLPNPAVISPPLQVALDFCKNMSAKSIHVTTSNTSIDSLFAGGLLESFQNGIKRLSNPFVAMITIYSLMIICADRDTDSYMHLSDSLRNLWNCVR